MQFAIFHRWSTKFKLVEHDTIIRHAPISHAAFSDLVRSLRDETVSDLRGMPTRVERIRDERGGPEDGRRKRSRLVRILLAAMASAGVFRLGGTIIGTQAFQLYEGKLGVRFTLDQIAQTGDIDIASFERLSVALNDVVSQPLSQVLKDFSFEAISSLDPGKTRRWRQSRNDAYVEFLTPSFTEDADLKPLPSLGVHAQSLHYLNYLLAEPIHASATYRDGVLVQIPRPERFAIHKLIVADRRLEGPDNLKSVKDRMQADFLIKVLAVDRPDDLAEALDDALARGPRWSERLFRSAQKSPAARALVASRL